MLFRIVHAMDFFYVPVLIFKNDAFPSPNKNDYGIKQQCKTFR